MSHVPQVLVLLFLTLGGVLSIRDHGKPRTGNENGWHGVIGAAIMLALLSWGGFWR